jgi:dynein heavy chain, axonemal
MLISIRITEAQNECRDKTKFLESIRRYLDNLTEDAHPQNCAVNILPALSDAMRTVESVSRYYARQGYLGLIFSKVRLSFVRHGDDTCRCRSGDQSTGEDL